MSIDVEAGAVCEVLVAAYEVPRPFHQLAPSVVRLEQFGLGGFGWGVAWLDDASGEVRAVRGLHRFADEGREAAELATLESRRFLVHLRRPSRLSTIQMADTQPFLDGTASAWCHNGFFTRAEQLRPGMGGRLGGQADSEVGWRSFLDHMKAGRDARSAFQAVAAALGGRANLAFLGATGELSVYAGNEANRMWRYTLDGGTVVSTGLHSDDASLFDLVATRAVDRERLELGTSLCVAEPQVPVPAVAQVPVPAVAQVPVPAVG